MSIPTKVPEGGFDPVGRRKINQIIDALESLRILNSPDVDIDRTRKGTFIRPKGGNGNDTTNNSAPRWG